MNKSILNSAIAAAMAIGLAACSSGGSDVAGIGGSGVTPSAVKSSGTITGFGSVYVNGVKFDSSSSTISIDDNPGVESDLAVGMRVTVSGTLIDDSNGTATSISFNDDLEGPVSNIQTLPYDTTRTLTILGRQVVIDSTTTSFDISSTLTGPFDFDSIADNNHVEISGFLDSNGVMKATRVELKAAVFDVNSIVEIKGTVGTYNSGPETFTLANTSGVTIDASNAIIDNNLPGGIVVDAFVEAKGKCRSIACTTVDADKVESGFDDFNDNDKVEVEGIITGLTDQNIFEVNGIPVDATNASERIPASINLVLNKEVEVEGTISNGTLIAAKVKDESEDIKVTAKVSNPALSTDSFQVTPVDGQPPITVKIEKSTEVDDDSGIITNPDNLITNLNSGDYVSVDGYDDGSGTVIASEFKREVLDTNDRADVIVQGKLEEIVQNVSIKVLGVTFGINDGTETEFEDEFDNNISQAQFILDAPDGTLVKIKDRDESGVLNGIADEVEIELP
jgi:hypothetical protein